MHVTPQNPDREARVLALAREQLGVRGDVLRVRMGYQFENGWITSLRAIVVVVTQRKSLEQLASEGVTPLPSELLGYPVEVSGPTLEDFAREDTVMRMMDTGPVTGAGRYFPPEGVVLEKISAPMRVRAFISPEKGWENLRSFLEKTNARLTVGIYDFGAPHVLKCIEENALRADFEKMTMAIQVGSNVGDGTKKDDLEDEETVQRLTDALGRKFANAWVRIGRVNGWVPSSYHIKVAVQDGKKMTLSSGNWQSSNLPDLAKLPQADQEFLLNTYNRDWHIIVENERLAAIYEKFLLHDFEHNKDIPLARTMALSAQEIFFLIPESELETDWQKIDDPIAFDAFDENRDFTVTPILSPDNYFEEVLALVQSAESELLIQNQTFNAPGEHQEKLKMLILAVLEKQRAGVTVKIIFRNFIASVARENLEALADLGFDPACIKMHGKCHTKGMIVDGKKVLIGSQNWSNDGVSVNRDASLMFEDIALATYFRSIFLHDWEKLARRNIGKESINLQTTTRSSAVPTSMVRIGWNDLLEMM